MRWFEDGFELMLNSIRADADRSQANSILSSLPTASDKRFNNSSVIEVLSGSSKESTCERLVRSRWGSASRELKSRRDRCHRRCAYRVIYVGCGDVPSHTGLRLHSLSKDTARVVSVTQL